MTSSFIVTIEHDSTDLVGIAEDIKDAVDVSFDVIVVKPFKEVALPGVLPTL